MRKIDFAVLLIFSIALLLNIGSVFSEDTNTATTTGAANGMAAGSSYQPVDGYKPPIKLTTTDVPKSELSWNAIRNPLDIENPLIGMPKSNIDANENSATPTPTSDKLTTSDVPKSKYYDLIENPLDIENPLIGMPKSNIDANENSATPTPTSDKLLDDTKLDYTYIDPSESSKSPSEVFTCSYYNGWGGSGAFTPKTYGFTGAFGYGKRSSCGVGEFLPAEYSGVGLQAELTGKYGGGAFGLNVGENGVTARLLGGVKTDELLPAWLSNWIPSKWTGWSGVTFNMDWDGNIELKDIPYAISKSFNIKDPVPNWFNDKDLGGFVAITGTIVPTHPQIDDKTPRDQMVINAQTDVPKSMVSDNDLDIEDPLIYVPKNNVEVLFSEPAKPTPTSDKLDSTTILTKSTVSDDGLDIEDPLIYVPKNNVDPNENPAKPTPTSDKLDSTTILTKSTVSDDGLDVEVPLNGAIKRGAEYYDVDRASSTRTSDKLDSSNDNTVAPQAGPVEAQEPTKSDDTSGSSSGYDYSGSYDSGSYDSGSSSSYDYLGSYDSGSSSSYNYEIDNSYDYGISTSSYDSGSYDSGSYGGFDSGGFSGF